MSLAIVVKGSEGIVLGADSRVTLGYTEPGKQTHHCAFDNATKLLRVPGHDFGAVTYGLGVIGLKEPRTAHSYLGELKSRLGDNRRTVIEYARELGEFYKEKYDEGDLVLETHGQMFFEVAGYDDGADYGSMYGVIVPDKIEPLEKNRDGFGIIWGGQTEIVARLILGFDPGVLDTVKETLDLDDSQIEGLTANVKSSHQWRIPYQILPLQDCIDLCISLIRTTIVFQSVATTARGVGGSIDVAVITAEGFINVQQKEIHGEI